MDRLGRRAMVKAIDELQKFTSEKIDYIVPVELGGGNMPAPIVAARQLGIGAVDGDYSGRAVPEVEQCTTHLFRYANPSGGNGRPLGMAHALLSPSTRRNT
jgi:DUF917 family protein